MWMLSLPWRNIWSAPCEKVTLVHDGTSHTDRPIWSQSDFIIDWFRWSRESEPLMKAQRRPLELATGLSTASVQHRLKHPPTFVGLWRLPRVTGPDTLPALCKPYAYWLGFIHLDQQGWGFGTLFSAIYKRLPLNCQEDIMDKIDIQNASKIHLKNRKI